MSRKNKRRKKMAPSEKKKRNSLGLGWLKDLEQFGEQLRASRPNAYTHELKTPYGVFRSKSLMGIVWEVIKFHWAKAARFVMKRVGW
jgi:hypothetical protein